ncbi:Ig-like domain-containing protein, partial [Myxococcota bacterium]|nr:Ig-like domain-containing protein [Myxococcota bacterium]
YSYTVQGTENEGAVVIDVSGADVMGNNGSGTGSVALDFTPPEILSLSASPDPASAGETVIISFSVSEELKNDPVVTLDTLTTSLQSHTGLDYSFSYLVTGDESGSPVEIKVLAYDLANNEGQDTLAISLTAAGPDVTAPVFSFIHALPDPAAAGAVLTITFDTDEELDANPIVSVDSQAASFVSFSSPTYTYEYTVAGTESEGAVVINVSGDDLVGNTGSGTGSLTLDYTAPAFSSIQASPDPAGAEVVLAITFDTNEELGADPIVLVDSQAASFVSFSSPTYTYAYTVLGTESEGSVVIDVNGDDLAGNSGSGTGSLVLELSAPKVIAKYPADNSVGISIDTTIRAIFSEEMNPATLNSSNFTLSGTSGSVSYDEATGTATFTPDAPLAEASAYTVTITRAALDLAGNPLKEDVVWTFHTDPASGKAYIAGDIQIPPSWDSTRVLVAEEKGAYTNDPEMPDYFIEVDVREDNTIFAWDDINADGLYDKGDEPRLFHSVCHSFYRYLLSTIDGSLNDRDIFYYSFWGNIEIVPTWTNPRVYESITGNIANVDALGDYTLDLSEGDYQDTLWAFDDSNDNGLRDAEEQQLNFQISLDTCYGAPSQSTDMTLRLITGNVSSTFTNPKVMSFIRYGSSGLVESIVTPDGSGNYSLTTTQNAVTLFAFDDLNANGEWEDSEPLLSSPDSKILAGTADLSGMNFVERSISGTVTPPLSWAHPALLIYDKNTYLPTTVSDLPAGETTAYSASAGSITTNEVYIFDDLNNDGVRDYGEPRGAYLSNPVDTSVSNATGIDIGVRQISGSVIQAGIPSSWTSPKVLVNLFYDEMSNGLTGSDYATEIPASVKTGIALFNDLDGDGIKHWLDEPYIYSRTYEIDTTGAGPFVEDIDICLVHGTTTMPPVWTSPAVLARPIIAPAAQGGAELSGSDFTAYTSFSTQNQLWIYDDLDGNGMKGSYEPQIVHTDATGVIDLVDATTSCAAGVSGYHLDYQTISGTAIAPPTWGKPMAYSDRALNNAAAIAQDDSFILYLQRSSDHYLYIFDDLNNNGRYDSGEPRIEYEPNPVSTLAGDVADIEILSRMVTGHISAPPTWTNALVFESNSWQTITPDADGDYMLFVGATAQNRLEIFDDQNNNGIKDFFPDEPSLSYAYNPVDTTTQNQSNIDIFYVTISGTINTPAGWTKPMVSTQMGAPAFSPDASMNFIIYTQPGSYSLMLFDDIYGMDSFNFMGEPFEMYDLNPIDATSGDVTGIVIGSGG